MSTQLSLLPEVMHGLKSYNDRRAYVTQGQERPSDLPRLRESAETMEALVLEWFKGRTAPATPSMCAESMGAKLTTVRPRMTQLASRTEGPRLERCKWIPRKPTEDGGSEGWLRYTERESR